MLLLHPRSLSGGVTPTWKHSVIPPPPSTPQGPGPCAYCRLGTLEPLECLLANSLVSPNRGHVLLISVPTAPSATLGTCEVLSDSCSKHRMEGTKAITLD